GLERVRVHAAVDLEFLDHLAVITHDADDRWPAAIARQPRLGHFDPSVAADQPSTTPSGELEAGGELCQHTAFKLKDRRCVRVDTGLWPQFADGLERSGVQEWLAGRDPGKQSGKRSRVAAHIEDAAAAQRLREKAAVGRRFGAVAELGLDEL